MGDAFTVTDGSTLLSTLLLSSLCTLAGHQSENRSTFARQSLSLKIKTGAQPQDRRRSEACQAWKPPFFLDHVKLGPRPKLSHTPRQQLTKTHTRFASTDREFFPGSQTLTKKLIYVTWQLFYTISWTLKILKETVVFYDVLYNLLAFKDDFPLLFLRGPARSSLSLL